jgi:hypothetical protein
VFKKNDFNLKAMDLFSTINNNSNNNGLKKKKLFTSADAQSEE